MKERTAGSWMFPSFLTKLTHFGIFFEGTLAVNNTFGVSDPQEEIFHFISCLL